MATSIEKLQELTTELETAPPAEGPDAILQGLATMALPHVGALLPDTPDELDAQLTRAGEFILSLRSDPAPAELPA